MISNARYREVLRMIPPSTPEGGQELILGEIAGLFDGYDAIWLPYGELPTSAALCDTLAMLGHTLWRRTLAPPYRIDGLYLGTPTIVDDKPLFPASADPFIVWTKMVERHMVRSYITRAESRGVCRVVTGLGSGDITAEERRSDMGPGTKVAAYKRFVDVERGHEFADWVLVRDVRPRR
jgi:hypothetical protein